MSDYLRVGVVTSPHGLKGEVKVYPTTDHVEYFKKMKQVVLMTPKGERPLSIVSARMAKQMVILRFAEVHSIEEVEGFRGLDLMADRKNVAPLKKGEYFICDLIGLKVELTDGTAYGDLTEVIRTGANDVYEVRRQDGKMIYVPVIPACVKQVDLAGGRVVIELMPGLEELT
ncbi:MAG: ribosome maturation factor RimM [Lachnospiraceae bacterium]|nr:ribosome maturation factor RimM [Lachnospiraceae bacterium]MDY5742003.1 ribosome maturation factor RimM [Lachnospiraceae bacterium]